MTRQLTCERFRDSYEYHGNTEIEHTRTRAGETVWRDWIVFDTVEEAADYFNSACAE